MRGKKVVCERLVCAKELAMLQAFSFADLPMEKATDSLLADLAGNAFTSTVVCAVLASLFLSLPFKAAMQDDFSTSAEDVAMLLELGLLSKPSDL